MSGTAVDELIEVYEANMNGLRDRGVNNLREL